MATCFSHTQGTTIGDHASFQIVAGNAITNNYHNLERDRITVKGKKIRTVIDSDIEFLRLQSSEILSVNLKPDDKVSASSELQVVQVKRMVQTAKVFGCRGKFTATTLEPVNEIDQDIFQEIAESVLQAAVCHRSALLTQVFAVTESDGMTMLTYNELTNANEVASQYRNKDSIVGCYLEHRFGVGVQRLRNDEGLTFPVTDRWEDWFANYKTLTCHYNPASLPLNPPTEENLEPLLIHRIPLRQDTVPQLNATEIVAHVEENIGDFLYLIASFEKGWVTNLSEYARNGLLTFGVVVNKKRHGILAHFSSTPSPKSFCKSLSPNVKASYSASGMFTTQICLSVANFFGSRAG
ncbi:hypothetical protein PQX77_012939 [Marasmius sp. AFHP31]|nr:hypothetical protein PQX77_012939 [Marasmius sp. AFHP31]